MLNVLPRDLNGTLSPEPDALTKFCDWFIKNWPRNQIGSTTQITANGVLGTEWYREPPFQVQLFIVPPNFIIPEHVHPNVDSYELYLGGDIMFSRDGKWVVEPGHQSDLRLRRIRVTPSSRHGGVFGAGGGTFMSIQHWLNGVEPHCITRDYDGIAQTADHEVDADRRLTYPDRPLEWRDAAPLEQRPPF